MKCLSLRQPYAELVVLGKKTIELRKWNTHFRGRFLVHASKTVDSRACARFRIRPETLATGAIIGKATLFWVKKYGSRKEFVADARRHLARYEEYGTSRYAFLLKDPIRLRRPISYRGSLNFFNADI